MSTDPHESGITDAMRDAADQDRREQVARDKDDEMRRHAQVNQ